MGAPDRQVVMVYDQNAGELLARICRSASVGAASLCVEIRLKVTWRMLRRAGSIFFDSFRSSVMFVRFLCNSACACVRIICLMQVSQCDARHRHHLL